MSLVAVCTPAGSPASTTTALLLGAMSPQGNAVIVAECDPSGGDVAAWAQVPASPGWITAVAGAGRTWAGLLAHTQTLPAGLTVLVAPSRTSEAALAVGEASRGFAGLLAGLNDVAAFADCGRVGEVPSPWATSAQLTLLVVRQARSAPATVAVVDRAIEALHLLRGRCERVGVVVIGTSPYPTREIEAALGVPSFGTLPDDPAGAAAVAGGWSVGRRAARTPLAQAAASLAARVFGTVAPAMAVATPGTERVGVRA